MMEFHHPDNLPNRSNRDKIRFDRWFQRFPSFLAAGSRERGGLPSGSQLCPASRPPGPQLMDGTIHIKGRLTPRLILSTNRDERLCLWGLLGVSKSSHTDKINP